MRAVKLCCRECSKRCIITCNHKSGLAHSVSVINTYTTSDSLQHSETLQVVHRAYWWVLCDPENNDRCLPWTALTFRSDNREAAWLLLGRAWVPVSHLGELNAWTPRRLPLRHQTVFRQETGKGVGLVCSALNGEIWFYRTLHRLVSHLTFGGRVPSSQWTESWIPLRASLQQRGRRAIPVTCREMKPGQLAMASRLVS